MQWHLARCRLNNKFRKSQGAPKLTLCNSPPDKEYQYVHRWRELCECKAVSHNWTPVVPGGVNFLFGGDSSIPPSDVALFYIDNMTTSLW